MNRFDWRMAFVALALLGPVTAAGAEADGGVEVQMRKAAAAYADAATKRDYAALASQWTERAQLVEGATRITGRDAIMESIRAWLDAHPQAALAVTVDDVEPLAAPLVRVSGTLAFTKRPGDKPVLSRFESLRVLEDGAWRLAESVVVPSHAAALDDLGWLVGAWQASDATTGTTVDARYEKAVGGYAVLGRTTIRPKQGPAIEALDVIHADRETGAVRSWVFDSRGARAEGTFAADGTGFSRMLVGVPAEGATGSRVEWTQLIVPGGEGRFTLQSIERAIDGRPLPDGPPLHFKRK